MAWRGVAHEGKRVLARVAKRRERVTVAVFTLHRVCEPQRRAGREPARTGHGGFSDSVRLVQMPLGSLVTGVSAFY